MGNHKFNFSEMMPNSWFYKLKDMNRTRNHSHFYGSPKKKQSAETSSSRNLHGCNKNPFDAQFPNASLRKSSIRKRSRRTIFKPSHKLRFLSRSKTENSVSVVNFSFSSPWNSFGDHEITSSIQSNHYRKKIKEVYQRLDPIPEMEEFPESPETSEVSPRMLVSVGRDSNLNSAGRDSNSNSAGGNSNSNCEDRSSNSKSVSSESKSAGRNPNLNPAGSNSNSASQNSHSNSAGRNSNSNSAGRNSNSNSASPDSNSNSAGRNSNSNSAGTNSNSNSAGRNSNSNSAGIRLKVNSPKLSRRKKKASGRKSGSSRSAKTSLATRKNGISDSFAIVMTSADPEKEFSESMKEMIIENNLRESEDLEELLACYLSLNSNEYHEIIIKAFEHIWYDMH